MQCFIFVMLHVILSSYIYSAESGELFQSICVIYYHVIFTALRVVSSSRGSVLYIYYHVIFTALRVVSSSRGSVLYIYYHVIFTALRAVNSSRESVLYIITLYYHVIFTALRVVNSSRGSVLYIITLYLQRWGWWALPEGLRWWELWGAGIPSSDATNTRGNSLPARAEYRPPRY